MSTELFNTFADQGYVILKGFLDGAHIEKLLPIADRIHAQWLHENHAEYVGHRFTSPYLDESILPDEQEIDRIANNLWYKRARQVLTDNVNEREKHQ